MGRKPKPKSDLDLQIEALKAQQKSEREDNRRLKVAAQERRAKLKSDADEQTEKLITLVYNRPSIWDKSHEDYRDRNLKDQAWNEITQLLQTPENQLRNKWKELTDTLRRLVDNDAGRSGDGRNDSNEITKQDAKQWRFYDSLAFLRDSFKFRESQSNFETVKAKRTNLSGDEDTSENRWDPFEQSALESESDNEIEIETISTNETLKKSLPSSSTEVPPPVYKNKENDRKRKRSKTQQVQDDMDKQIGLLAKVFSQPDSESEKFLSYLGVILSGVPEAKQAKCRRRLISLAEAFTDGTEDD